jgi:hypothetical protein
MKKYIIYAVCIVVVILVAGINIKSCKKLKQENKRLLSNQTALLEDVTFYRTRDSLSAASVQILTLTNKEYEKHFADLEAENKSLKIENKRLLSISRTSVESNYDIIAEIQEKVIEVDSGKMETVRCMEYINPYINFNACEINDSLRANIRTYDTIVQFVHRIPHQWWFFKWGTKAIRQDVVTKNPYSQITYTQYIELKRKKKK